MKGYAFRLEAVLKLRKLKEENCRMELGQLLNELSRIDDQINHDKNEIKKYYDIQESYLKAGTNVGKLQSLPGLVMAKDKNIELLMRDKNNQQRIVEEKREELAKLRGELKVMENLKEKDYAAYKKEYSKKLDQTIEEQTQNWMSYNRKEKVT